MSPVSKRSLVVNTALNAGSQVVSMLVSLVTLPLLLRAYGNSVYGLFLLASSVVSFLPLFDMGAGTITAKEIAQYNARGNYAELWATVRSDFLVHFCLGVLSALALVVIAMFSHSLFALNTTEADLLKLMLFFQAGTQLLSIPLSVGRHILTGFQHYKLIAFATFFSAIGTGLAIVFVLVTGQGPLVLTAINSVVVVAAATIMSAFAARQLSSRVPREARTPRFAMKHLLGLGFPVFLIQLTAFLMQQQTDKIVLGIMVSASSLALFEVAAKMSLLSNSVNDLAISALMPHMVHLHASNQAEKVRNTFLYGSRYLSLLICPALATLFAFAPTIAVVWCGEEFRQAGEIARFLLLVPVINPLLMAGHSILMSKDKMAQWAPYTIGASILNLILSVVLVRVMGIQGVALASCVAGLLEVVFYARIMLPETEVPVRDWVVHVVIPQLPALGIIIAGSWALSHYLPIDSFSGLIVHLCIVLIVAYVTQWLGVLSRDERSFIVRGMLSALMSGMPGRQDKRQHD
ncbi:MAG: hypothetical protein LBS17_01990 [Actinomycetes bacterium]|jgi:O-antigen/teichoic acid export membrane protein|nr:hypothetical protein [Actinomycetes bacterium]